MTRPIFTSSFAEVFAAFLAYKRALGRRYNRAGTELRTFDRFVARCEPRKGKSVPLHTIASRWLTRPGERSPATIRLEMSHVRQLCLFARRTDPTVIVPEAGLSPRSPRFKPYIFTADEVRRLLRATSGIHEVRQWPGYRALTFRTLLEILYCTGLRPGEPLRLRLGDVDVRGRTMQIVDSKGKSRIVPFDKALSKQIQTFIEYRRRVAAASPQSFLFVKTSGRPYRPGQTGQTIRRLLRAVGIKGREGRRGPRPYDLRHTFACHRLLAWYRRKVDLLERLPWLSAYMGHDDLVGTEVYLTATPELLELASRRFAARFHRMETL
jgi:integrase/recombinase XerD